MTPALAVCDLVIEYHSPGGQVRALDGVGLTAARAEILGIVGESGSGKSTLATAIGRLLAPSARRVCGDILIDGRSIYTLSDPKLRALRADELGFVFQDPIGTLDPTRRIGLQVKASLGRLGCKASVECALTEVGLTEPGRVAQSYPHELSGGMAQRVSIAMAIARRPKVVVADEPTAALDASIKRQILDLLVARCRETEAALILFSHDLHAIRTSSDRVAVMYGGRTVETGPVTAILEHPGHPYTVALLQSALGREGLGGQVKPIPGTPTVLTGRCEACAFAPRCTWTLEACTRVRPEARQIRERDVVCHRAEEILSTTGAP